MWSAAAGWLWDSELRDSELRDSELRDSELREAALWGAAEGANAVFMARIVTAKGARPKTPGALTKLNASALGRHDDTAEQCDHRRCVALAHWTAALEQMGRRGGCLR